MKKIVNSKEATRVSTNRFMVVSLVKWEKMQIENTSSTNKPTCEQQASNKQATTTKESKEYKEVYIAKNDKNISDDYSENEFLEDWKKCRLHAMPEKGRALDKAFIKHRAKQTLDQGQSNWQSTYESDGYIDKQVNNKQTNNDDDGRVSINDSLALGSSLRLFLAIGIS